MIEKMSKQNTIKLWNNFISFNKHAIMTLEKVEDIQRNHIFLVCYVMRSQDMKTLTDFSPETLQGRRQ